MPEQTRPARGMRDFLPDEVRQRDYVIGVVEDVYRRYGFEPLETPALENIETLTGKYGDEGAKLIFKVLRRGEHEATGETDLALRYDLTVPLARVVAEHRGKLPRFFKRYQIQPVWRADRPARGRFREFFQCDVDAIGSRSPVVEAEVCAAVSDVLRALGFADFVIRLNHRALLSGMLESVGVPIELHNHALVAIDKLDKIGRDGVATELSGRGIAGDAIGRLLDAYAPPAGRTASTRRRPTRIASRAPARMSRAMRPANRPWPTSSGSSGWRMRPAPVHTCSSIPASRAACPTTPARSWRLPCRTSRAVSVAAGGTMG